MQITYPILEKILLNLGYTEDQLISFQERFLLAMVKNIGTEQLSNMDESERKSLIDFIKKSNSKEELTEFFQKFNSEQDNELIIQSAFEKVTTKTLRNILQKLSAEQKKMIAVILAE